MATQVPRLCWSRSPLLRAPPGGTSALCCRSCVLARPNFALELLRLKVFRLALRQGTDVSVIRARRIPTRHTRGEEPEARVVRSPPSRMWRAPGRGRPGARVGRATRAGAARRDLLGRCGVTTRCARGVPPPLAPGARRLAVAAAPRVSFFFGGGGRAGRRLWRRPPSSRCAARPLRRARAPFAQ